jgi:tetratricopeptide (TPR) repeat protein
VIAVDRAAALHRAVPVAALLAVLAVTAVGYSPALDGDFLFDDKPTIEFNPRARSLPGFVAGWSLPGSLAHRPVTELTFAFDAARSNVRPRAFHETSLVLHLAVTLLLFAFTGLVFRRAGASGQATWAAVMVAGLFAAHPIQTQAVAYLSQRAEVLSSLLTVATLLLLLMADDAPRATRAVPLGVAALGTFTLAAGSKMIAGVAPVLFLLALAWFPNPGAVPAGMAAPGPASGRRWLRRGALLAPLAAVSAIQAAIFFGAMRGSPDVGFSVPGLDPWHYLLTEARVIPLYLRLIAWPSGQNVDHDIAPGAGLLDPPSTVAGGLLLLLLLAASAWGLSWTRGRGRERSSAPALRVASFGLAWFLVLLAPTSSVVPLADVVAEHRVYLASWGLIAAVVALAGLLVGRLSAPARVAAVAVLAIVPTLALATALHARSSLWADPMALWRDAAGKSPARARPLLHLGNLSCERGDLDGAIASYGSALAVAPEVKREAILRLIASAQLKGGRAEEALAILGQVRSPAPETVVLQTFASVELGDLARAERYARQLLDFAPAYPRSHEAMGRVLEAKGELSGAREAYRRAAAQGASGETLLRMGHLELRFGARRAACVAMARAAESDDSWVARQATADAREAGCP